MRPETDFHPVALATASRREEVSEMASESQPDSEVGALIRYSLRRSSGLLLAGFVPLAALLGVAIMVLKALVH
jgi:hypothetical protein